MATQTVPTPTYWIIKHRRPKPAMPPTAAQHYGVRVSNAGSSLFNGNFQFSSGTTYTGPGGLIIDKNLNYPGPGITSWVMRQAANIFYYAPDSAQPWTQDWSVGSFGTGPAPRTQLVALP